MRVNGKNVIVFDIMQNRYRLIATVIYGTGKDQTVARTGVVFTRAVLTHQEYDSDHWKDRI